MQSERRCVSIEIVYFEINCTTSNFLLSFPSTFKNLVTSILGERPEAFQSLFIFVFSQERPANTMAVENEVQQEPCLEWPDVNQEDTFNQLSEVLLDSYRLNQEMAIMSKILGKYNR